jgi:hypothetical protein
VTTGKKHESRPQSVNRHTLTFLSDESGAPTLSGFARGRGFSSSAPFITRALAFSAAREALGRRDEFTDTPIIVAAENGTLRLSGTVPTEHHKQLAAEAAQEASPGYTIENHLVVPK